MRGKALEVMNSTYGKFVMPITEIARLLHTDDIDGGAVYTTDSMSLGKDVGKPPAVIRVVLHLSRGRISDIPF